MARVRKCSSSFGNVKLWVVVGENLHQIRKGTRWNPAAAQIVIADKSMTAPDVTSAWRRQDVTAVRVFPGTAKIPSTIDDTSRRRIERRQAELAALAGPAAVLALEDERVRSEAARLLHDNKPVLHDPWCARAVLASLDAAELVSVARTNRERSVRAAAVGRLPAREAEQFLGNPDPVVRAAAVRVTRTPAPDDPSNLVRLETAAASTDVGTLRRLAADPDDLVAVQAVRRLVSLGEPGDLLDDQTVNPDARRHAYSAATSDYLVRVALNEKQDWKDRAAAVAQLDPSAVDPADFEMVRSVCTARKSPPMLTQTFRAVHGDPVPSHPRRRTADIAQPKLVMIDLDGTALDSKGNLPSPVRDAITAAVHKGVAVVIVSMKDLPSARDLTAGLPVDVYCGDGHYLVDAATGTVIDVVERPRADDVIRAVGGRDDVTVTTNASSWTVTLPSAEDMLGAVLQDALPGATVTQKKDKLRVTPARDKRDVAQEALRRTGVRFGDAAAIGDGIVDKGMFAVVNTTVAMGNAISELASEAKLVVGTNDEAGVAEALDVLTGAASVPYRPSEPKPRPYAGWSVPKDEIVRRIESLIPEGWEVICEHITWVFGEPSQPPAAETATFTGYVNDGFVLALVAEVDQMTTQKNGKTPLHVTVARRNAVVRPVRSGPAILAGPVVPIGPFTVPISPL